MLKKTKIKRRNTMEPNRAGMEAERSSSWIHRQIHQQAARKTDFEAPKLGLIPICAQIINQTNGKKYHTTPHNGKGELKPVDLIFNSNKFFLSIFPLFSSFANYLRGLLCCHPVYTQKFCLTDRLLSGLSTSRVYSTCPVPKFGHGIFTTASLKILIEK